MPESTDKKAVGGHSLMTIRIAAIAVVAVLGLIALEGMAQVLYNFKDELGRLLSPSITERLLTLDPYEEIDREHFGHWRLRPNFGATSEELIQVKEASGKWIGAAALRRVQSPAAESGQLTINADGYKGPPIRPEHPCPRILSVGDSVTFGIGAVSYPDFMQQAFANLKLDVEVINAGVEGYSPRNVLLEIPRYRKIAPDIVTIYIGWNALYSMDVGVLAQTAFFKLPWLLAKTSLFVKSLMSDPDKSATTSYRRQLYPDKSDPEIAQWKSRTLPFAGDLRKIIDAFKDMGARIYLINLFGLFQEDAEPSQRALQIGHLPIWTDNPYVFATATEVYNQYLSSLADNEHVKLINLRTWARESFQPPEDYFFDSVHFNREGLRKIGDFLASTLNTPVLELIKSCSVDTR